MARKKATKRPRKKTPKTKKKTAFAALLAEVEAGAPRPVYLFHGEDDSLTRGRAREILHAAIPEASRGVNLREYDGPGTDAAELVGHLRTYSLMPGLNAVAWFEAPLFRGGGKRQTEHARDVERLREQWTADQPQHAAKRFLALCAEAGVTTESLASSFDPAGWLAGLRLEGDEDLHACLAEVAGYCVEQGLEHRAAGGAEQTLHDGLAAGVPPSNLLVLTTRRVRKGSALLQLIEELGAAVPCAAIAHPGSSRRAALAHLRESAGRTGVRLDTAVLETIADRVGFHPGLLDQELAKVAAYADDAGAISTAEVEDLVLRNREDPIWQLTGAVADRDFPAALAMLDDQIRRASPPLMLLGAVANQWRRLAVAHALASEHPDLDPDRGLGGSRNDFGERVKEHARATGDKLVKTLVTGRKPYGIWVLFRQSKNFHGSEIENGFKILRNTDRLLKMGSRSAGEVMTRLLFDLLG